MPDQPVLVTYDTTTISPTPYVSVNNEIIRYGTRFASVNKITLNGQIIGTSFAALAAAQSALVDAFKTSYKNLTIVQGSNPIIFPGCSFESISFDNSRYVGVVPYSIELLSYSSDGGFSNILEPKDEIKISAGNDGFGTVSHSVSAKGFSIGNADTAINNAKNFVTARSAAGLTKIAAMAKLDGSATDFTPILVNVSENLNRLDLTYSIEKTYKFKLLNGVSNFLTSYSTTLSSGAGDDFVTATIQGEIRGAISETVILSDLYAELSSLNPYSIVSETYGSPNGLAFCSDPITFSVTEDPGAKKINFNASYDNSQFYSETTDAFSFGGCYFDAKTSYAIDELTNTIMVEVKGDIKCRGGKDERYTAALAYLGELTSASLNSSAPRIYNFAKSLYDAYFEDTAASLPLNTIPNSLEVTSNDQLGAVSVSASFDNKDKLASLASSDYSIQYVPSNTVYSFSSSCNNATKHLVVDMNTIKRERASLDIQIADPGLTEANLLISKTAIFTDFENQFVNTLANVLSIQKETSSDSVQGYGGNPKIIGSAVGSSCVYSFEPKDLATRRIIKS